MNFNFPSIVYGTEAAQSLLGDNMPMSIVSPGLVRIALVQRNDIPIAFAIVSGAAAGNIARNRHVIPIPNALSLTFRLLAQAPSPHYTRLCALIGRQS